MLKHPHKNDTAEILEESHETGAACNEKDPIASNVVLSEIEIEKEHERLLRVRERLLQRAHERLFKRLLRRAYAVNERKAFFLNKGKPDFFTELPEDMFNAIFYWIPDLKTHKAFILTCKAHYEKWKKKVVFQACSLNEFQTRCLSEGLKISWWHNSDYQDLYQNKDKILSFLTPCNEGIRHYMLIRADEQEKLVFWITARTQTNKLFPSSDEESRLQSLSHTISRTEKYSIYGSVYGFYKFNLTVKELHQNAIEKVITKENHYVMRKDFFNDETQIEAYITTKSKKYINPFFKPR